MLKKGKIKKRYWLLALLVAVVLFWIWSLL